MFSKSCEYGLRAIIYIAQQSHQNNKVNLTTISKEINSPQAFTAKILQQLTRNNIVNSIKGPHGGFTIEAEKMQTKISDVVFLFDGDNIYNGCGLGLKQCDESSPCPLHYKFIEIRNDLKTMLEKTTLEILINEMNDSGVVWLKR